MNEHFDNLPKIYSVLEVSAARILFILELVPWTSRAILLNKRDCVLLWKDRKVLSSSALEPSRGTLMVPRRHQRKKKESWWLWTLVAYTACTKYNAYPNSNVAGKFSPGCCDTGRTMDRKFCESSYTPNGPGSRLYNYYKYITTHAVWTKLSRMRKRESPWHDAYEMCAREKRERKKEKEDVRESRYGVVAMAACW